MLTCYCKKCGKILKSKKEYIDQLDTCNDCFKKNNVSKILYLTLKRVWFEQILNGDKTIEYREIKPYWIKRLVGRHYTHIQFRNGYSKKSPTMLIEYLGLGVNEVYENKLHFTLRLGEIIKIIGVLKQSKKD